MTADDFLDRWCPASWPANGHLRHVARTELLALLKEAEAVAAAKQRALDAAVCRAVLDFWASDSPAPDPYEAGAVAASEMCAGRILPSGEWINWRRDLAAERERPDAAAGGRA